MGFVHMQHAGGLIVRKIEYLRLWLFIARGGRLHARASNHARHESDAGSMQQLATIHFAPSPRNTAALKQSRRQAGPQRSGVKERCGSKASTCIMRLQPFVRAADYWPLIAIIAF
jgi:hypothetical protein